MARDNERPARDNAGRRGSDRPNNDREGNKKIFNRRDKYEKPEEGRGERGERRSFRDRNEGEGRPERRSFSPDRREGNDRGERRSFGNDRPSREDGERRSFDRREGGERRSFGGDRREGAERKPFEGNRTRRYDREREGGERRSFNSDRPDRRDDRREGGERRSFNSDRPRREDGGSGERRSFERREGGERRSFGGDRREGGERRSFNSDRPRREDGERRSFNADRPRREDGERRSYGNDRPQREGRERRDFDGDRKPYRQNREERFDRSSEGKSRFGSRFSKREDNQEAPDYNLSRYKDNPRIKKTNRKEDEDGSIRLNRYIANAGVCSRREADVLIESGEIKVNGEVITEMGYKVQPSDTVMYGKKILSREKMVYVLLNKPKDFITTTEDPEGRKTVMDLVASASKERIFPVGRLDRNTTGLLLFTNDGELAQKLTHPSNNIKKIYQVELDKPITKADFQKIVEGVELEDGVATVDDVALLGESNKFLGLEIHIGRNRIVRRIFEHLGYDVVSLDRVQYASLTKKDVPRGEWRFLTEKEVIRLKFFM